MPKPHEHKKMAHSLLIIQLKRASDECVGGPLGDNISDGPKGVTVPGSKALALVDDILGSRGGD